MVNEVDDRKRAYQYLVEQAKRINWSPLIDSDKRLADVLDVPISELTSLKEGLSNPSDKLVTGFKKLVCTQVSESEVDLYLTKPCER